MNAIEVHADDLPILVSLAHGQTWTTACDLHQLTPEQRREKVTRLRLGIETNGRVRNWGHFVAGLASAMVTEPCRDPERCGRPRHSRGPAPKGWVKVEGGWFCGWGCVEVFARKRKALP